MRRGIMSLIAGVLALAVVAACTSDANVSTNSASGATAAGSSTTIDMADVRTYTDLSRNHVNGSVHYPQSPPVGGDHDAVWQNCGFYDQPVRNENAVHSMEHGAVWLAYDPELPSDQVAVLRALARGQSHVLVSPYEGLAAGEAVVATAWGEQLRLPSVADPRLAEFVATYQQGPQTPEPGAPCSGATGDPVD